MSGLVSFLFYQNDTYEDPIATSVLEDNLCSLKEGIVSQKFKSFHFP